uniref:60S ribosome subunit biogenesis protein NIP7 pre-PUA domain-containing protein n=1 Tax=Podarcis muralis TaxID=64176 RepID=A0A670K554_PODMU
ESPLGHESHGVTLESVAFSPAGHMIQLLVDRPDGAYCFHLHKDRVYYLSERILKLATNIPGENLVSLGTCFGKFTKIQKFRLQITALDCLAPYAKYKVYNSDTVKLFHFSPLKNKTKLKMPRAEPETFWTP